jgi:hypothetical protein
MLEHSWNPHRLAIFIEHLLPGRCAIFCFYSSLFTHINATEFARRTDLVLRLTL